MATFNADEAAPNLVIKLGGKEYLVPPITVERLDKIRELAEPARAAEDDGTTEELSGEAIYAQLGALLDEPADTFRGIDIRALRAAMQYIISSITASEGKEAGND